ncbi:hypothetical protein M0802_004142 [Mischocyttarus mexicanus]|nr:hypothetical protein M0802_004142 [Mischocyttarus mexicanus]
MVVLVVVGGNLEIVERNIPNSAKFYSVVLFCWARLGWAGRYWALLGSLWRRRETKFNIARIPISRIILECGMVVGLRLYTEDSAKCG